MSVREAHGETTHSPTFPYRHVSSSILECSDGHNSVREEATATIRFGRKQRRFRLHRFHFDPPTRIYEFVTGRRGDDRGRQRIMSTMNSPTRERFPPSSSRRSSVGQPFRLNSVRPKPLIIPSYASSIPSVALPGVQSSVPSPRYPSFSAAGSNAGSNHFNALLLSTTGSHSSSSSLTSNVTARFKRAQVRIKSITKESPAVNALNPDKLDLLELEDPDQVFRLFNVRDVRGIEERAK